MTASALLGFHFILVLPALGLLLLAIGLSHLRLPDMVYFRRIVATLFLFVFVLTWFGLFVYVPYRAPDNARAELLATNPELHTVIFEHKEFLSFAVIILLAIALVATLVLSEEEYLASSAARLIVRFSLIAALCMTLLITIEGILVTRGAPVH